MYVLDPAKKRDPVARWALPDRIFFGHGACHILAAAYLAEPPLPGFYAERIVPAPGMAGNHIYVTNGVLAFDYHGYCRRERLLAHHWKCWSRRIERWAGEVEKVEFSLDSTADLNAYKMLGPDQYLHDPFPRARRFLARVDHAAASCGV